MGVRNKEIWVNACMHVETLEYHREPKDGIFYQTIHRTTMLNGIDFIEKINTSTDYGIN